MDINPYTYIYFVFNWNNDCGALTSVCKFLNFCLKSAYEDWLGTYFVVIIWKIWNRDEAPQCETSNYSYKYLLFIISLALVELSSLFVFIEYFYDAII